MVKVFKPGRVVILLTGRRAGKKAIVIKSNDDGTQDRPYEHALVAGIERYPRKVMKSMSKKKIARRSRIKPFVKIVNLKHMMPTRYTATDIVFDKVKINKEILKDPARRRKARRLVKAKLEERYKSGKNRWLFQKLRF
ncbi:60S ribosomal protein L27-like [Homarus americanus]|uniref:Large ribosomal subunit protein eL27 n=1 Tax=Homarus americanus TaxID=6706 RepID=A0A8J5JZK1_HOMAM|nr:60S ribosomal protein L27-like [Homarus americanus]XP_042231716.1 60S ribosomal protein L27-like [Homarus americanus]XP_042231717.1 60S ribosomal protein L27-like [Homarus americanus]KAG7163738.1 60S ribosomal protein L27-like [Homarus americanus]|eukprot:GEMP01138068.1.p1 GENE.GEMP01138068.1~~GEMP01138068.1.p1  ORF type:complete len:138 (+),score=4.74 GEMP01138068.1:3-416(+)